MDTEQVVRDVIAVLALVQLFMTIRIIREQERRATGVLLQYSRFAALAGWCLLSASVVFSNDDYPFTWRIWVAMALQILSIVGVIGMRQHQRSNPPPPR